MESFRVISVSLLLLASLISCKKKEDIPETEIIFLHHSTGLKIWGVENSLATSVAFRLNKFYDFIGRNANLPMMFKEYNSEHKTNYKIYKRPFPKSRPYGWHNFPYDYYNIWVANAGMKPYKKQPTLEMLSEEYDIIIFKHCFPVSNIMPDKDTSDINSYYKSIANYKLQYKALKNKMHEFPNTKFILFTGAALVKANTTEDSALRAKEFFTWVKEEWDQPGDNIFIWDLYSLQTEESLYFKNEYAESETDSHPNKDFSANVSKLLFNRIIDVIDTDGENTSLTGNVESR